MVFPVNLSTGAKHPKLNIITTKNNTKT